MIMESGLPRWLQSTSRFIGLVASRLLAKLRGDDWRDEVDIELPLPPERPSTPALVTPAKAKLSDNTTKWVFKRAILDRLEEYFVCMRRLKKHDPDAYEIFSRVGCAIPSDKWAFDDKGRVGPRISIGGITVTAGDEYDTIMPSFIYFQKKVVSQFASKMATNAAQVANAYT